MNAVKQSSILTLLTVIIMMSAPVSAAEADIVLPCPAFRAGDAWEYEIKLPLGRATVNTTVLKNDGKNVRLATKTAFDTAGAAVGLGALQPASLENEYEYVDSASMVRKSANNNGVQIVVEPPEPMCGRLPQQWSYTNKIMMMGRTLLTQSTVTARSLGKEKITVPAGTFEAMVVEFSRQDLPSGPSITAPSGTRASGASPSTIRSVQVIYAVEKVGFVRILIRNTVSAPQSAAASNPQTQALLQEAIAKKQRGEDVTDLMKQLSQLSAEDKGRPSASQHETSTELELNLKTFVVNH